MDARAGSGERDLLLTEVLKWFEEVVERTRRSQGVGTSSSRSREEYLLPSYLQMKNLGFIVIYMKEDRYSLLYILTWYRRRGF